MNTLFACVLVQIFVFVHDDFSHPSLKHLPSLMLGYCDQSLLQANFLKKIPNTGNRFSAGTGRKDLCPVDRLRGEMQGPVCARQADRSIRKDPVCARKAGATRVVSWFQGPMWWEDRRVEVVVSACFRVALLFSRFSTPQPVSCLAPFVGF
jgi:hypothetical protein